MSLTTYGHRIDTVPITIEAIGRGVMRPSRIMLWLDEADWRNPPRPLRDLADRGLELRPAKAEWGPHKKYFPYCLEHSDHNDLLVTADDDVIYPRHWLADLAREAQRTQDNVIAHRARLMTLNDGSIGKYGNWPLVDSSAASSRHVPIGMAGVAYPPYMQTVFAEAGDAFMTRAPRADDLWLHLNELRARVKSRQVSVRAKDFPLVPDTQTNALAAENQAASGNDKVVAALYGIDDIASLCQD